MDATTTDQSRRNRYRQIVLATDGSVDAGAAVATLGALAWPEGTTVTVVRVGGAGAPADQGGLPATGPTQDARRFLEGEAEDERARSIEAVAAAAARLREARPEITVVEEVRAGDPAAEILALAEESGADLVTVGARGHAALGALVLGSVSEALVEGAVCPVLVVRGSGWGATPSGVLVGIGPDDDLDRLGDGLPRLPLPDGTRVVAATVGEGAGSESAADRLVAALRESAPGWTIESRSLAGDVAGELLRAAAELGADLIVVGARDRRGMLARMGLGSVSRGLVRRAECSVLVVRGGG